MTTFCDICDLVFTIFMITRSGGICLHQRRRRSVTYVEPGTRDPHTTARAPLPLPGLIHKLEQLSEHLSIVIV